MIITITSIALEVTKNGDEYLKVSGHKGDGETTTKSVFDNLKAKWPMLKENATLDFKMEQKGQFWNVVDINPVELPPPQEAKPVPEGKPPADHMVKEAIKQGAEVIGSTDDTKLRSMAIAYAKDLACAGKIEVKDLTTYANKCLDFILNITRKEQK